MGGKRCAGLGLLLAPILLLFALDAGAEDQQSPQAQQALAPTIILLDGSISMWARLGGQSKVGIVRSTLTQAFTDYEDRIAFGLVAFGHRGGGACTEAELLAKPGELSAKSPGKLLFGAGFKPKATKPVAAALVEAAKQTPPTGLDVVLITDGPDTCKANVCATVKSLKQAAPGLRIHVIGFDPKAKQTVKALACVAKTTGGQFLTAANANDLKQDLNAVLDAASKSAPRPVPVASRSPAAPPALPAAAPPPPPADTATPGPASATPQAPQSSAVIGPQAPAQTDMAKLAAIPPKESAAPARTPAAPGTQGAEQSAPVPVNFNALLTEGGPQVKTGLIWRVFTPQPGANGARKLVSTHHEAMPTAALVPGEYLVNAAYGLSNLTKKINVESGRSLEETFILNTGGLKLAAVLSGGATLPASSVHFDILSDEEDQFGNRHKILNDATPGVVIRLNAGAYHLVSTYGDANGTVRADVTVEPGKITEATVKQAAAPVTFKLVQSAGGEALADTKWQILTTTGDVVKEAAGALPTHILAAGDYAVVANHNGESYTTKFRVEAGAAEQIEVVMESGPASPEALKAITEPPPPPPAPPAGTTVASPGSPDAMPGTPSMSGAPPSPDTGMAFGNNDGATPREPGLIFRPSDRRNDD